MAALPASMEADRGASARGGAATAARSPRSSPDATHSRQRHHSINLSISPGPAALSAGSVLLRALSALVFTPHILRRLERVRTRESGQPKNLH
eukprot:299194-Rhodomonas_salina.4